MQVAPKMLGELASMVRSASTGVVDDVARAVGASDAATHAAAVVPGSDRLGASGAIDAQRGVEQLRIGILRGGTSADEPTEHVLFGAVERTGATPMWLELDQMRYEGDVLLHKGTPVGPLDAVITRYTGAAPDGITVQMEQHGIELLNNQRAVATTSSKIKSQDAFDAGGVNAIPTRFAMSAKDADAALHGLPDDVVVKPYDGESGKGVEMFTNHAAARTHIAKHFAASDTALLVQRRVEGAMVRWTLPDGTPTTSAMDYRVLITLDAHDRPFVDTVFQRIGAPGSGKSNIDAGGWGQIVPLDEVPQELIDSALKAHASIPGKYGIAGIDVIPVGRPLDQPLENHAAKEFLVTEANSSPGITDLNRGTRFADAVAARAVAVGLRAQAQRTEGAA